MSTPSPSPAPAPRTDRPGEARARRAAPHDYWPFEFWDATTAEAEAGQRPAIGDWASL